MKNKMGYLALLAIPLAGLGIVGSAALAANNAQTSVVQTPPAQIQTQLPAISGHENSATDQDNIQDQKDNGQPESASEQENGTEAKDGTEANENLPGGGHQDQAGVNADHQFEGVE